MFPLKFVDAISRECLKLICGMWGDKPLSLQKWQPGMQSLELSLKRIPIWVKILRLPLNTGIHLD